MVIVAIFKEKVTAEYLPVKIDGKEEKGIISTTNFYSIYHYKAYREEILYSEYYYLVIFDINQIHL